MNEILKQLPVLLTAILMNTGAGLYYRLGTQNVDFSPKKLFAGLLKALIIAGLFLGTAFCFDAVDLSTLGATPVLVMNAAITLYVSKALISLGKILGIQIGSK